MEKINKDTKWFRIAINNDWQWSEVSHKEDPIFHLIFSKNAVQYKISIEVIDADGQTAKSLAERKYAFNAHSAFPGENIAPFKIPDQVDGIEAWGCRFRWVDGGSAPFRFQHAFMEIDDKIIQFDYMAKPDDFNQGVLVLNEVVKNLKRVK